MGGKTNIAIKAKTNIGEVKEKIQKIQDLINEASTMIDELASEGVLVEFVIER